MSRFLSDRLSLRGWLVVAFCGLALSGCRPEERTQPNIVWIVIDTLRQDHLSAYGYPRPTSPRIAELAADGLRYANAFSQAPWTTPSVASMLTSQYPSVLGIKEEPNTLSDDFVLLSEVLQERGWATVAVISHYFLDRKWNFEQGFDIFDESNVLGHGAVTSPGVAERSLEFVGEHRKEPFFLFSHFFDPHYDYIEHDGYRFSAEAGYDGPIDSGMSYEDLLASVGRLGDPDVDFLRRLYDSEIAFTDAQIGRLIDGLKEQGIYDDTLIVVTADHGEEFLERGTIGHGNTLFDELIRVPLVIKLPGMRAGRGGGTVLQRPVGLIDVYPTILDHLGLSVDHSIAGRSLLGRDLTAEPPARPVYSETDWGLLRSVVHGRFKMIHRIQSNEFFLYDLATDPQERDILSAKLAQTGTLQDYVESKEHLERWLAYLETHGREGEEAEISEEQRRKLQALGYLN